MSITEVPTDTIKPPIARNIGELIEYLSSQFRVHSRIPWFRGHRSATWNVVPRIWRCDTKLDERNLTNRFCSRAAIRYETLPDYDNDAIWLSLMQHYRLPTRLLDWSRSPLVATYFALEQYIYTEVRQAEDAVIWVLEPHKLNLSEGFGDITPSIEAHMCAKMLAPAFIHVAEETNKVLAVMAAEKDIRMFVQQGCFTIHSNPIPLNEQERSQEYLNHITIPAEYVKRMAFEIDVCGFRKGDIFPDLGNLADELTNRSVRDL